MGHEKRGDVVEIDPYYMYAVLKIDIASLLGMDAAIVTQWREKSPWFSEIRTSNPGLHWEENSMRCLQAHCELVRHCRWGILFSWGVLFKKWNSHRPFSNTSCRTTFHCLCPPFLLFSSLLVRIVISASLWWKYPTAVLLIVIVKTIMLASHHFVKVVSRCKLSQCCHAAFWESGLGWWKTQGREKIQRYHKDPSPKAFLNPPPHLWYLHRLSTPCHFL